MWEPPLQKPEDFSEETRNCSFGEKTYMGDPLPFRVSMIPMQLAKSAHARIYIDRTQDLPLVCEKRFKHKTRWISKWTHSTRWLIPDELFIFEHAYQTHALREDTASTAAFRWVGHRWDPVDIGSDLITERITNLQTYFELSQI